MSNNASNTKYDPCLILSLCPGLSTAQAIDLIGTFGSAADVVGAGPGQLRAAGLDDAASVWIRSHDDPNLQQASAWLGGANRHLVTIEEPRFPPLLIESGGAPLCLFVEGDPTLLSLPQLAVVGSRKATPGGSETAHSFAAFLAEAGFIITSGLAEGIDTAAHEGALAAGGSSIAVMGTGPDQIYPRSNTALAQKLRQQGALVTEFAPGMPPHRDHFPRRNRIISALSLGVLVVEAGMRSGSLITARYAGAYNREIFAVPGSIHNPMSKGCHRLIKQGAKLVETGTDIISELGSLAGSMAGFAEHVATQSNSAVETDPDYAQLLRSMGFDPITIDRLATRSGLTAEQLSSMLLILELEGKVSSLPGGYFQQAKV